MPRFTYQAFSQRGDERTGELEAANAESAAAALKARGLFPTEVRLLAATPVALVGAIEPAKAGMPGVVPRAEPASSRRRRSLLDLEIRVPFVRPVSGKERALFTRQLATLLKAGMPLLRGLEVLARQEKNRNLKRVVDSIAEDVRSGGTLSEAMARHEAMFDRLYVNMIRAGEAGGVLEVVLGRLAQFEEKSLQLRGKVKAAMIYPLIVMTVAVLILAGLLVFVVPKFQQIFADLLKGVPLPVLTQAVLVASDFVREHYLVATGLAVGAGLGFKAVRRTPAGARVIDGWLLRLPLFGELIVKSLVARFTRTFGTLLSSGVPILQAIQITRDTTGNSRVAAALDRLHDRVKEGEPVAKPLEAAGVFPPMVASMIEVGEHTGQLPEMLDKVADIYDGEVDTAVAGLSSLIEPILIVLLAGVVGTIVIALFLPIVRIVQLLT